MFTGIEQFEKDAEAVLGYAAVLVAGDAGMRLVALDLDAGTTKDTPVDKGPLQMSWRLSRGSPDLSTVEAPPDGRKYSPGEIAAANAANRGSLRPDPQMSQIFYTNNKDYAKDIERGRSGKAPRGMLGVNIARVRAKYAS